MKLHHEGEMREYFISGFLFYKKITEYLKSWIKEENQKLVKKLAVKE